MTDDAVRIVSEIDKRWEKLTIANDFVFCKTMLNADLCRDVLEAILGVPIDHVEHISRKEQIDASPDAKGIRLDVYVRDEEGTVYNVEMQATDTFELPQRSRYYHALMALDQLGKGRPYKDLKNSYVIFICSFDPFDLGRRVYCFENRCQGAEHLTLGDGTKTLFLSATAPKQEQGSNRLDEFLDYVARGEVSGELSARLAAEVASVLDNQKWRLEFMMLEVRDQLNYDRGVLVGRREGLAEGLTQGESRFVHLLKALLADGRNEDIARIATDPDLRSELYRSYGIA